MKKTISACLLLCGVAFGGPVEVKPEPQKPTIPRYRHVQDHEGKILATIDSTDGSIEYKADPKSVVSELIKIVDAVAAQCQKKPAPTKKSP